MRIVVCLSPRRGGAAMDALPAHDAHAVEAALRISAGSDDVEIVVGALAPPEALGVVRGALAMGATRGALVVPPAGLDDDVIGCAGVMSQWLLGQAPDLVLTCPWSGDIDGTLFIAAISAFIEMPVMTGARRIDVLDGVAEIDRQTEDGDETMRCPLPCAIELGETVNQARYPTVRGRARARNLPIELVRPAAAPAARVAGGIASPIPAERSTRIVDDPDAAVAEIVAFLREAQVV